MPAEIKGFLFAADAIVECRQCGAKIGKPCKPVPRDKGGLKPGYVHIGRRIRRLLLTAKKPELRDEIEEQLVELLIKEMKIEQKRKAN